MLALVAAVLMAACSAELQKGIIDQVKCQVCEAAMDSAVEFAAESKEKDEDAIADVVDGLCTVKKPQGKWTAKYDVQQKKAGQQLVIVKQEGIGKCNSECAAIQRACSAVLKNKEDDIVALLLGKKDAATLKTKICKKVCAKKVKALTDWKDEAYAMRDMKEVEAEERVEKMRAETGQNFKMWSRDEISGMSQSDIELEAAKDALGAARRETKLQKEHEDGERGIRPSQEL